MELVTKLFNEESQTSKISLIQLLPGVYPFVSTNSKITLGSYINKYSCDDNLAVKRELYMNQKVLYIFISWTSSI